MGEGRGLGWFSLVAASNSQALRRIILDGFVFHSGSLEDVLSPRLDTPIPGVPSGVSDLEPTLTACILLSRPVCAVEQNFSVS